MATVIANGIVQEKRFCIPPGARAVVGSRHHIGSQVLAEIAIDVVPPLALGVAGNQVAEAVLIQADQLENDAAVVRAALVLLSVASAQVFNGGIAPGGAVAFSPVTDLALTGESFDTRAEADPYFTKSQAARQGKVCRQTFRRRRSVFP